MFDRNNTAHLLSLQQEVLLDPITMGYAAVVDQTNKLLTLLNEGDDNVGNETVNIELSAEVLLDVIDTGDFASNQVDQGERDWIMMLFNYALTGDEIEKYRAKVKSIFSASSQTIANIDALIRKLSRAEVLFGQGTIISKADWFAARDYTG